MRKQIILGGGIGLVLGCLEGSKLGSRFSQIHLEDGQLTKAILAGTVLGFFGGMAIMGGKERNENRYYGFSFFFAFVLSLSLMNIYTFYDTSILNSVNVINGSAFGASCGLLIGLLAANYARHS